MWRTWSLLSTLPRKCDQAMAPHHTNVVASAKGWPQRLWHSLRHWREYQHSSTQSNHCILGGKSQIKCTSKSGGSHVMHQKVGQPNTPNGSQKKAKANRTTQNKQQSAKQAPKTETRISHHRQLNFMSPETFRRHKKRGWFASWVLSAKQARNHKARKQGRKERGETTRRRNTQEQDNKHQGGPTEERGTNTKKTKPTEADKNALGSGPDARLPRGNRARAAYFSLHFSDFSVFWALESCITSHFFSWLGGRFDIRGWKSSQSNPTNQIQPIQSSQWVKWVNIWVCLFKIFLCFEPLKFLKCRSKMWSNASIPANPTNPIQKIQSSQWVKWVNILVCLFHIFFMFGVCSG